MTNRNELLISETIIDGMPIKEVPGRNESKFMKTYFYQGF